MAEIWGELEPRVRFLVQRQLPGSPDIDDVCQDVAAALLDAFREDKIRGDVGPYVWGIARNLVLKAIRRRTTWRQAPLESIPEPGVAATAEREVLDAEARRTLRRAIAALPAEDAEVIRLTYQEEMTSKEVAAYLGRTPDWVRQRLTRARRVLHAKLAEVDP